MNKSDLAKEWCNHTIIKTICFSTDLDDGACTLILDLAVDEKIGSDAISIKFDGVSKLRVGEIGGGISQLCRLDVIDIREQQWDRLNYRVLDYESERIGFMCRDFQILKKYRI
ncbi:hypothetical protein P3T73_10095 [Kiritimatiellota bacterium B12222]|nr:hypothetical protein P3T73_10095 [Kiritimatiellota bacterium B12222]